MMHCPVLFWELLHMGRRFFWRESGSCRTSCDLLTGLAIGIALACGMAVNMAVVLRDAVEIYGEAKARSKIIARSITRYLVVVIVFFVMMKWELGSLPAAFIGVLGLKISAYLQPLAHRFISKLGGRGDVPSDSRENEAL